MLGGIARAIGRDLALEGAGSGIFSVSVGRFRGVALDSPGYPLCARFRLEAIRLSAVTLWVGWIGMDCGRMHVWLLFEGSCILYYTII